MPVNPDNPAVAPANAQGVPPAGLFMPANAMDVDIWAHDLTVQAGKTYQYKIRYSISNPVFTFKNLCPPANQQWANVFELTSAWSAPTLPFVVPDTTNLFLANANLNKGDATFDVFVWGVNGVVKTTVKATPGDLVDENLKLTLLDIRPSGDDAVALLVDENGVIYRCSRRDDGKNKDYRQLQQESAVPVGPLGSAGQ